MFLKDKATVAEPLHQLLAKNKGWEWGQEQEIAFNGVKRLLTQESFLMQFTETLPVVLVCDASPFGVGAVLSHRLPNGKEAPIAYFSRTLSTAERNYGQIDREALAAVAGVKRFHEYLFGRQFELVTDHKPLLGLLAGNKPTPDAMPARMLRWALFLSAYSYTLVYRQGKEMGNADALSRVPLPDLVDDPTPHWPVFRIDLLGEGVVTAKDIAAETEKDADLRTVMDWVKRGWPKGPYTQSMLPFAKRQHEISIQEGCVLWGERVISPPSLREEILRELHEGHPGIVRMKALARSYVWWPSMDKEIEDWVGGCQPCQQSRPNPPVTPAWEWENPRAPWSRIHIDFAGPFHGQTFLVVVDAYSKWVEVKLMRTTTAEAVIRTLRQIFTTHGFPDTVVSDNGPQFTAAEFEGYLAGLGVKHSLSPPFNPSTNGQAERAVRTTKEVLSRLGPGDWQERIDIFLLAQHITPSGESGKSPAELLMGRKLRSKMDRLHPRFTTREAEERAPVRTLKLYSQVFARDYTGRQKWAPGKIHEIIGPKTYIIELGDGQYWHRHINQLRERKTPNADWRSPDKGVEEDNQENNPMFPLAVPHGITEERVVEVSQGNGGNSNDSVTWGATPKKPRPLQDQQAGQDSLSPKIANGGVPLRRSARVTTKPAHLKDYVC